MLWYRALVGRAFFDPPAGPQEFAYLPDDMMRLLPAFQGEPSQPLGRQASPIERALPILASDASPAGCLGLPPPGGPVGAHCECGCERLPCPSRPVRPELAWPGLGSARARGHYRPVNCYRWVDGCWSPPRYRPCAACGLWSPSVEWPTLSGAD